MKPISLERNLGRKLSGPCEIKEQTAPTVSGSNIDFFLTALSGKLISTEV
jgi:hypothetical protein